MVNIPSPESPPTTQSEFTAANVFGLFLTLILCLLSQPVGSLIYCAGRPGLLRSLVLALWRLNPLACVCEALIISIAIGRTTWATFQNRHVTSLREWRTRLRRTAAALLLLRAQTWTKDGFLVVPRLFWVAGVDGYPPDRTMGYREFLTSLEPVLPATTHGTTAPSLAESAARIRMARSFDLSGNPNALPSPDDLSGEFKDLEQLLGAHASRNDLFIQAVASVGVLAVVVKITASVLPWSVKLPACFMISGWCAVQILLLLLHGGEPSEAEMQKTAHLARDIDRIVLTGTFIAGEFRGSWIPRMVIIWLTPLPVAVYLATFMTNLMSSEHPSRPTWLWVSVIIFEVVFILPTLFILLTNILSMILILGLTLITGLVFALSPGSTPEEERVVMFFTTFGWYLHFIPLAMLLILPATMTPPGMVWGDKTGKVEDVGILLHVLISFVLFFALLHFYDPSETFKPEWLEWLG